MKLKQIKTDRLSLHRDMTSRHGRGGMDETIVLRGLAETFGYRPTSYHIVTGKPAEITNQHIDELWLDLDEARELHRALGLMLEGTDPADRKRRAKRGWRPGR